MTLRQNSDKEIELGVMAASDVDSTKSSVTNIESNTSELCVLRSISNALNRVQAVIEFKPDGTIISANENFLKVLGYELSEIVGKHHRIFCDEGFANSPAYVSLWSKLASGEFDSGEYKRIKKDGQCVWINASYNPVFDENGLVDRVVKFATDITEDKRRNAEIESKMQAISRSQAIIEFNVDGTIKTANENFLNTMGYHIDDIKNRHHKMFCDEEYAKTEEYKNFWIKLSQGEFHSGRFLRFSKAGNQVWIQATYNPVLDESGRVVGVMKVATDITKQVEIESKVKELSTAFSVKSKNISDEKEQLNSENNELSAAMISMTETISAFNIKIESVASNVKSTNELASATQQQAESGKRKIEDLIEAMAQINKSSADIEEIIRVISDIANLTNLLAFNAAIEAARAGEHGLGFSVVAEEVRKLAEKSSSSAKEISRLISESIRRIQSGSLITKDAGDSFSQILTGVSNTTESMSEIAAASEVQLESARNLQNGVERISRGLRKSSKASELIATEARELQTGADDLLQTVLKVS